MDSNLNSNRPESAVPGRSTPESTYIVNLVTLREFFEYQSVGEVASCVAMQHEQLGLPRIDVLHQMNKGIFELTF